MARAWFEDEMSVTETVGSVGDRHTVTTSTSTTRIPIHDEFTRVREAVMLPTPLTEKPRSRALYYFGCVVNTLVAMVGVAMWAWGFLDGSPEETWAPAGATVVLLCAFFGAFIVHGWRPNVCTCPSHSDFYEECR